MWAAQIILAVIGLSSGLVVAGGLFSFISGLGVISDFADRTHTGEHILLYETSVALGGILGNIFFIYHIAHMENGWCQSSVCLAESSWGAGPWHWQKSSTYSPSLCDEFGWSEEYNTLYWGWQLAKESGRSYSSQKDGRWGRGYFHFPPSQMKISLSLFGFALSPFK